MMNAPIDRRRFIQVSALALGSTLVGWPEERTNNGSVQVCPKSAPPAKTLFAFRMGDITTRAWDLELTLSCLQGIVNRSQPRLYLIHDRYDELWLEWLQERGDVKNVRWIGIGELFERFLPEVDRMFVTDPAVPASVNVATMLAAVRGGLVATPDLAEQFNLPMGRSPDSSEMGMDLHAFGWKKTWTPTAGRTAKSEISCHGRLLRFSTRMKSHSGTIWLNSKSPFSGFLAVMMRKQVRRHLPRKTRSSPVKP